ncbi:MAG: DDE-type integrase/transposase/recombinase [Magnetospirillum sp.]|nr:DDE-type integrase/transposase/recombinase [Magnetospirillum sp.]
MSMEWHSAAEWAEIAREIAISRKIMPHSERNTREKADRDGWLFREREQVGGGREYPLSALPEAFQKALRTHRYKQLAADQNRVAALVDEGVKEAASACAETPVGEDGQMRRDVRLAILALFDRYCLDTGKSGKPARIAFAQLYNDQGTLAVPAWVRQAKSTISPNSLSNWDSKRGDGKLNALAGAYGARKGTSVFDLSQSIHDHIVAGILRGRRISATDLLEELRLSFGAEVEVVMPTTGEVKAKPLPTARSLERWIATWKEENEELIVRETNPDRWKSGWRVAIGDLYGWVKRPNQLWEIDASPADLLLKDGRYSLYVLIDIYTRRVMILVTKTPRTAAALLLLKRGIETWGKPETIRTDKGSDFISVDAKRFFALLRIVHDECDAYSPEQKGSVERHVKTVQHSIIAQLPGFVGHSVAERKIIEARKSFAQRLSEKEHVTFEVALSRDDLQAKLDDWSEYIYGRRPHGGLDGKSPWQVASEWTAPIVRLDDPARLGLLLAPAPKGSEGRDGIRIVSKKGISVEKARFWDNSLTLYMRKPVFVRLDPHDMGVIWVFTEDHSEFICKAVNVERQGIDRAAMAGEAHAAQKAHLDDLRAKHRAARRGFKPHVMVERRLVAARNAATKVVTLTRASETTSTPALDAIGKGMAAGKPVAAKPATAAQQARQARLEAEMTAPAQVVTLNTKAAQFARAVELERRLEAGEVIPEGDMRWLNAFRSGAVYRSRMRIMQEHGLEDALAI